jgi:TctA family transporter
MPVIPIAWYQRTASISKKVYDGIDFVVIAVGLFGVAEIASNLELKGARGVLQSTIGADLDLPSIRRSRKEAFEASED